MPVRAVVSTGQGPAQLTELDDEDLPDGDVTVDVAYSSLNYKDGLAVTGRGRIVRRPPLVCGIDLAGTVAESASPDWSPGDEVVVTGWGLSETHPGGYTERQRLRSAWLVARPPGLTLAQTMAVGTAGLTAMLCVLALEDAGLSAGDGEVVVTGAGGGVGSVAVALLAHLGHRVVAATGRPALHEYLRGLGAADFVTREELARAAERPLESARWAGAIDTVGSTTLASVLRQAAYGAPVAACGLAGGDDLPITVLPFILRGVRLLGVDSVQCPTPRREQAWARLAADLDPDLLDRMTTVEPLTAVPRLAEDILAGRTQGRVVVDVRA
ncbi:acryloyl-CoA reductase [Acidimicrobiaceae bacterium USS-CC1]|uniref:Acryloyl-CoA reductase n=1 Tax=Acidiferrimicrobium australe TaxID=2664430 RepID=A0ABW9QTJ2_9ACTN|nr:acryloyl-CoA reductase [Acidiferrimicrobium australe]